MTKKLFIALLLTSTPVLALDSGPRVVACDYRFNQESDSVSDVCLKNSFTNMGVTFVSYEPIRSKKIFRFSTNEPWSSKKDGTTKGGDGKPLFYKATINKKNKKIWEGSYLKFTKGLETQCRPAGLGASIKYKMSNGGSLCVWN